MPFSPIDALMQVSAPKRSAEPAPRADSAGAFQPALEQAYKAEAPAKPTPSKEAPECKPAEKSGTTGEQRHSKKPTEEATAAGNSQASDASIEEADVETGETVEGEDAAEISAEAAAAVIAAQEAAAVDPIVIAVEGEPVEEVAAIAEPQTPATDGANGSGDGESSAGDEAESSEIKLSTLNSTHTETTSQQSQRESPDAEGQAVSEIGTEEVVAPTVETAPPAPGAGQTGGEKLAATPQADESTYEQSEDAKSEEQAESKEGDALPEVKAEAVAEETAASAANSASVGESTGDEAADSAPSAPEAGVASPNPAAKATGALDRLMEGRSLRNSKEPNDPNGMPTIDRARFVQRVEGAMKAAHQRDGKIQVRLSPPELGSVKIELAMQNGVLSAKLEAETPAARNLLLDSLPALRERLAQQDIRIEKFDVDVRQEGGNAGSGQTDDRAADQSGERQQQNHPRPAGNLKAATPIAARAVATASSAASGLDVRV